MRKKGREIFDGGSGSFFWVMLIEQKSLKSIDWIGSGKVLLDLII